MIAVAASRTREREAHAEEEERVCARRGAGVGGPRDGAAGCRGGAGGGAGGGGRGADRRVGGDRGEGGAVNRLGCTWRAGMAGRGSSVLGVRVGAAPIPTSACALVQISVPPNTCPRIRGV